MASKQAETAPGMLRNLMQLASHMPQRRRREFVGVIALMLIGAIAEMVTLGAVIPFLALLADPSQSSTPSWLMPVFSALGYSATGNLVVPMAMLFAGVALTACIIRLILSYVSINFVYGVGHDIGVQVFRHIISQPYAYYTKMNTRAMRSAPPAKPAAGI